MGWISFYADCEHEFLPLKSGYRLALLYNVCFHSNPSTSKIPSTIDSSFISKFGPMLDEWKQNPSLIGFRLQHSYSYSSLRIENLKNPDHSMVCALKTLRKYYPIEVYLVTITRYQEFYPEPIFEDPGSFAIDYWVDMNDKVVNFGDTKISPRWLYPKDAFDQIRCYSEQRSKTGNNGKKKNCFVFFFFFLY